MRPFYVALFTLKEYRRSTWFYLELLAILVTLYLYRQNYWGLGKQDVYFVLGLFTVVITPLTTLRLLRYEKNPRIYILLTKRLSRFEYMVGKALAAVILDGILIIMLFVISYIFTGFHNEFTLLMAFVRMTPLFLVLIMTVLLFLLLSPLILHGAFFLLGIAYLILSVSQPEQIPSYFLLPIKQLIKLCYANQPMGLTLDVLQGVIYAIVFFLVAVLCFNLKEINYEQK